MQHRTDHRIVSPTFKRSASWVATVLCLALPVGAQALGVGQLQVRSALNQPLNAEVELLQVKPGDLESLNVRIATQSLGGAQPSSDIFDYRIESREGRHFLLLTSSRAVREPLLNFLVELDWAQGRLLREMAIFLDPPDPSRMPTLAEAPPSPPAPRTPPRQQQPAAAPSAPPPAAAPTPGDGIAYGPVRRGETLWNIAQRTRPGSDVSMQQMMQAIYQANPQAFARANMDTLMAGVTLRIPSVDGRTPQPATPPAPAPRVAAAPPTPRPEPEPVAEPDVAVEPSPVAEQPAPADEVQVRLVPPPESVTTPTASTAPAVPRLRREGEPFRLQLASLDNLRERVRTLREDQPELLIAHTDPEVPVPAEPEVAVTVEPEPVLPDEGPSAADDPVAEPDTPAVPDTPLAAGDDTVVETEQVIVDDAPRISDETTGIAEIVDELEEALASESTEPDIARTSALESLLGDTSLSLDESRALVDEIAPEVAPEPAPTETLAEEPDVVALAEPAAETPTPVEPVAEPVPAESVPGSDAVVTESAPPRATSSGIDIPGLFLQFQRDPMGTLKDLRSEPIALPLLGGALLLLLLLGWLIRRAKRGGEEDAGMYDPPVAATGPAVRPRSAAAVNESGGEKQDKTRRLGRVDFLVAGGSYREAENLVRLVMVDEPDNPALRMKLLDIYYKAGDGDKFIETAAALKQQLNGDSSHPLWQKATRMGNEMSPGHPLFNDTGDEDDTVVFGPQGSVDRPGRETVAGADETVTQPRAPRLAFPGEAMPPSSESSRSDAPYTDEEDTRVVPSFTLSDLDKPSTAAVMADREAEQSASGTESAEDLAPLPDPREWDSSDKNDQLSEDESFESYFAGEPPQPADDQEESIEIKLDLAQAYLDMDDRMGARTLLDEVLREGSEAQQSRAKSILDSMS